MVLFALLAVSALQALQQDDQRVADIGHALATHGTSLCPASVVQLSGMRAHSAGQYGQRDRAAAIATFGLGDYPALLTVARSSGAELAGFKQGDWVLLIGGEDMKPREGESAYQNVERVEATLMRALAKGGVVIRLRRGVTEQLRGLEGDPGCASTIELVPSRKLNAKADGRIVQVTTGVLEQTQSDDELAFIIAHEMAHNILGHRARLDRIGRSNANIRDTEIEADRLAVRLMRAAGYDPLAAARFWERFGSKTGAGIFSDGRHLRTKARVQLLRDEAASLAQ